MPSVDGVVLRFGGITALDNVGFTVADDEICGLIGPNGAGKTSLFNCITRIYQPNSGAIRFDDTDLLGLRRHQIIRHGIARTFQNLALWPEMTVLENTIVGAHGTRRRTWCPRRRLADLAQGDQGGRVRGLGPARAARPHRRRHAPGRGTSVRHPEAGRAGPCPDQPAALLLLDEPAGGLTHSEVADLGQLIRELRDDFGFSALLVEHHMGLVIGMCDHVVAMDFGRTIADGATADVQKNPAVVAAYLGRSA